jgi:MFS family permease
MLYSSVFALQGLSNSVIPVLPELAGLGNGDSAASNLLFSGYFVGALLALLPFGILADRIGNLKIIVFGVFLTMLSGLVIFFSDNLWTLGIFRFLEGIGCGAFFPAAFSMISEWEDSQNSLGEFNFLLNAGLATGVFLSGILAGIGIKTAIGIFTILTGISFILLLPEAEKLMSLDRKSKKIPLQSSNGYTEIQKNPSVLFELESYLKKASGMILKSSFGKIWGISVILYGTTGLLTANYPDYSAAFLTKTELGLAISASYFAAMISSLIAGRINVNYKNIVRAGIILTCAGILLSMKMPLIAFSFIGAGGGIAVVGLITATAKISSSGFAMGLFNTGIYAGLGLGPVFGSLFLENFSYEVIFFGSALVLLAMFYIKLE